MKNGTDQKEVVKKFLFLSKDDQISYEVSLDKKRGNFLRKKDEALAEAKANEIHAKAIEDKCKEALKSENLVILTGAGSSMDGGGKSVSEIWEELLGKDEVEAQKELYLNKVLGLVTKKIEEIKKEKFFDKKNLEELLSRLEIERKAVTIDGIRIVSMT
jgi:beta-phosphoglucomutase-like phosphatase (HAD superfamily)